MKATRDVITDLLPLYFSGEASADTRAMVEEYFAADPEFERMARRMAESVELLKSTKVKNNDDVLEEQALIRARNKVRSRNMSLGAVPFASGMVIVLMLVVEGTKNPTLISLYP